MTDISRIPAASRRSPGAVRNATFSHRIRGLDETEVREFLDILASEIEAADAERGALRAEIDRLRRAVRAEQTQTQTQEPTEINSHAVALFSQAQQVADRLVAEAVQHARDLMTAARAQQREILQQAQNAADAAEAAAREAPPMAGTDGAARGYATPIPEVEYVRTFARVAQVQLRSVLDALAEQVDKLGDVPQLTGGRELTSDSEVNWHAELDQLPQFPTDRRP
ncbi:DivIVA domain-containing protein [Actinopolymorpha alba]|uniref:DivIVA domain-containing protein n=1 Tax=Actinopolymorpha alba TaxID=533267 RepID=UPI0003628361|nr:DivIVA domain-containing protein [Actinopolymorpha alba]